MPRRPSSKDDWEVEWSARHVPMLQLALIITGGPCVDFVPSQPEDTIRDIYRLRIIGSLIRQQQVKREIQELRLSFDRSKSNPENLRLSRTHSKTDS